MAIVTHPELLAVGDIASVFITRTEEEVGESCSAVLLLLKTGGGRCCLCGVLCGNYAHGLYARSEDEPNRYRATTHELCQRCARIPADALRHHFLAMAKEEICGLEPHVLKLKVTVDPDGDETVDGDDATLALGKVFALLRACEANIIAENGPTARIVERREDRKRPAAKRRAAGKAVRK